MAIDQAHKQNNALVKGDGGAVGLTENPKALLRWMVAGPETARVIQQFEITAVKHEIYKSKWTKTKLSIYKMKTIIKQQME